jgi:stearoyl-CoA desaturase (delta-9 desaturase)
MPHTFDSDLTQRPGTATGDVGASLHVASPGVIEDQSETGDSDPGFESAPTQASRVSMGRLPLPETVDRHQWEWEYLIGIVGLHLLLPLALIPWLFSWTGLVLTGLGCYVFGTLGINLCYHRLLTHRGFKCPLWLEHTFAILGLCCLQDTPARWVATHRVHHKHSDEQPDPHSPLVAFFWGHVGWLLVKNREIDRVTAFEKYSRDVLRDPFYFRFERGGFWFITYGLHALLFFTAGMLLGWLLPGGTMLAGLQFGLSLLVWGVIVRTVLVWHITWSVNSLTHLFGYQTYQTGENSRNNWFVALISNGEGWHNNHHADQRSAAHGHAWWEFDVTYLTIRALQAVGLAWDVVRPRAQNRPPA